MLSLGDSIYGRPHRLLIVFWKWIIARKIILVTKFRLIIFYVLVAFIASESLSVPSYKLRPIIAASAKQGIGLEELKPKIYQILDIIRVYTKTPGQKPAFTDPIILDKGSRLEDAAASVHKDFRAKLKYARIWGSGKHDGIMIKRDHILHDGDIVELHLW